MKNFNRGLTPHLFHWLKKGEGFTLMEMLAVMAITLFLGVLLLANSRDPERKFDLRRAVQSMSAEIRKTQALAIAAQSKNCGGQPEVPFFGLSISESATGDTGTFFVFTDCNKNNLFDPSSNDTIIANLSLQRAFIERVTPAIEGSRLEVVYISPVPSVAINGSLTAYPTVSNFSIRICHIGEPSLCSEVWGNTIGNVEIR